MTKEAIQSYSLRVTQANQSELTVITFEIFLDYINDALNCHEMEDMKEYRKYLDRARAILSEIMAALNFENEVSFQLIKIYEYVYGVLVSIGNRPDTELLNRVAGIMNKLLAAFRELASKDETAGVMENAQQLYAGLTYGKGYLNETCTGEGSGWKA